MVEPSLSIRFTGATSYDRDLVGVRIAIGGIEVLEGDIWLTDFLESLSSALTSAALLGGEHEVWNSGALLFRISRRDEQVILDAGKGRAAGIATEQVNCFLRGIFVSADTLADATGVRFRERALEVRIL